MPRPKSKTPPKYRHHKARDLAVVTIDGRDHYLGKYASPDSYDKYAHLIAEWRQGILSRAGGTPVATSANPITVAELTLAYWDHCVNYYSRDGKPNGRTAVVRSALRAINSSFADLRVGDFGPLKLLVVRQKLIDHQLTRRYINDLVATIAAMFQWAVSQELVPVEVYAALKTVRGLRKGKSKAIDRPPVSPVCESVVHSTLEYLSPVLKAMVQLQLLTGARPGEIRNMRPCDIALQTEGLWCYRPQHHKTEHHDKDRRIYLGPRSQEVLRPFLDRDSEECCFSPRDGEQERRRRMRRERKSRVQPSQSNRRKRSPKRIPGSKYTKDSYCRAIRRACEKAGVAPWTPHQLRHTTGTSIRKQYGLESAQVVLGHSGAKVTQIYAERDHAKAADIMREIG